MTATSITLATDFGTVTGLRIVGQPGNPLVVCIPGGSYNAHYFDVPGHSLLEAAAARGFPVVALDRPGYGGSTPLEGAPTFAGNARVLTQAVDRLWAEHARTSPGVVLVGHSMGGAIGLHIAAAPRPWPLLGIAISGIHVDAPVQVAHAWSAIPDGAMVDFSNEQRIQFMFGPEGSFDPDVVASASAAGAPIPVEELREVVGGWIADFSQLAPRVDVPVHYVLAEHDHLWVSSADNVEAFGAALEGSPSVVVEHRPDVGHNIDHSHGSDAFHASQLDFAAQVAS
jgi:pimeloyl-ACP methyl ester carboxylesterase